MAKAFSIERVGDYQVDTWWDRYSRNWITQVKDMDGNQIGDADYSGNRYGADITHERTVRKLRDANTQAV